ncbi:hypothetical protein Q7G06_16130, partial [Acinetobacter baumannii]|nr:hypothetical protein [Acinetobacter baumannii]
MNLDFTTIEKQAKLLKEEQEKLEQQDHDFQLALDKHKESADETHLFKGVFDVGRVLDITLEDMFVYVLGCVLYTCEGAD